jgi:hypothetical protein
VDLWTRDDVSEYGEHFGVEELAATHEVVDVGEWDIRVRLAVETLETEAVYDIVRNLPRLITGDDIHRPKI